MYSHVHGVVGTGIVLAVYAVSNDPIVAATLGGTLAFLSHDPMDRLGEKNYGSMKTTAVYEGAAKAENNSQRSAIFAGHAEETTSILAIIKAKIAEQDTATQENE